jgi:hypothetical protein
MLIYHGEKADLFDKLKLICNLKFFIKFKLVIMNYFLDYMKLSNI